MQPSEKKIRKIAKVLDEGNLAIAQMIIDLEDKIDAEIPNINNLIQKIKGDKGDAPTKNELIALIRPLIPEPPKDGHTPTRAELLELIKPLIPIVENGKTPTKQDLLNLISPLIPKPVDTKKIVSEASTMVQEAIKPLIPTIESIESDLPKLGKEIRNGLELLQDGDKLSIDAIENLRKELDDVKKKGGEHIVSTSNRGLYQLLDVNVSGIQVGQSIKWDGIQWIPYTGLANPVEVLEFDTTYTPTGTEPTGSTYWDDANHTISTVLENGAILQHGFELYTFGTDEGNDFPEGSAVSVKGSTGNKVAFELTDISDSDSVNNYIGLLTTPVDSGNRLATREGAVRGIKTDYTGTGAWGTTWVEGQFVYVSSTPGGLTNVEPTGRVIRVGTITNVHGTQGVIELDRLILPTLEEIANSFEAYNKNLSSYPYTITETSPTVTTLAYNTGSGTITKTITETSPTVTTIVLSGIPAGLPTTKTITETSPTLTTITYS